MDWAPTFKAAQITELRGDHRPGNRADARNSFDRVFHVRKEFLNMGIELGELPLEKLELCDHRKRHANHPLT